MTQGRKLGALFGTLLAICGLFLAGEMYAEDHSGSWGHFGGVSDTTYAIAGMLVCFGIFIVVVALSPPSTDE